MAEDVAEDDEAVGATDSKKKGTAVRSPMQRTALSFAARCDGRCSVLRGKGQSLGQAQAEGYGAGLFVLLHGERAA